MALDTKSLLSSHAALLSCAWTAGTIGGIINCLIAPLCGALHLTTALGVQIVPPLLKDDLYSKTFWGGLWGLLLLLPWRKLTKHWALQAFLLGCFPSLVQLFLVFPLNTDAGAAGLGLGTLTPVFVFFFNTVGWSFPAFAWFALAAPHNREKYIADPAGNPLLD
ncbi:hypothetical protein WJX72_006237 [[Myrmecia] bisecta]|uniref:Uncharacterized protein n=1 Tax=[Myrmecia] bisecta TaxID=41462 RepID=A0AAW1QAM7_9CHLO